MRIFVGARATLALGIVSALGSVSCYATQSLPSRDTGGLQRGDRPREILLSSGQSERVRVRPASWLRFRRADGVTTVWTEARKVRVTPELCVVDLGPDRPSLVLRWDEIAGVEVNDLDMGRTIVGVVVGTSMVTVAFVAETMIVAALSSMRVQVNEIGLTRAVFEAVVDRAGQRPGNLPEALEIEHRDARTEPGPDPVLTARPLFSPSARRHDLVEIAGSFEVGADARRGALLPETTAMACLRFAHIFEVGAGVGVFSSSGLGAPPLDGAGPHARVVPRLRLGLHLDLDPARRISLVLAQEVGLGGSDGVDLRAMWGLRVRVGDRWQLGVLPANPRVTFTRATVAPQTTFVSAIELGFVL